jgi:hypothetical protein
LELLVAAIRTLQNGGGCATIKRFCNKVMGEESA